MNTAKRPSNTTNEQIQAKIQQIAELNNNKRKNFLLSGNQNLLKIEIPELFSQIQLITVWFGPGL